MSDFPVKSVGLPIQTVQPVVQVSTNVVPALEKSMAGRTPAEQNHTGAQANTQFKRLLLTPSGRKQLTGPPPAFEANILDVETKLPFVIKQIEAARERERNKAAVEPAAQPARTKKISGHRQDQADKTPPLSTINGQSRTQKSFSVK